ncbi:MAG: HNH endonuclease [Clostridia bacterium]|nr:HNH endonuclease [Clostridia bacterium]
MWDGYHAPRWRNHVRPLILRRDKYRCQEARRYGKIVEATVVHHIWPAEDYPEYAWCDWNLVALSLSNHRAMHNEDGSLSPLGEAWRRRTTPPLPSGHMT